MKLTKLLLIVLILLLPWFTCLGETRHARFQHLNRETGMPKSTVTTVIQDREGYIWLATWAGLARYDGYTVELFRGEPGKSYHLPTNRINHIFETAEGNIACKFGDEYFLFDRHSHEFTKMEPQPAPSEVPHFYIAPDSVKLLIGDLPPYKGRTIRVLYHDPQGGFWVAPNRGVDRVKFTPDPVAPYKYKEDVEEEVRSIGPFFGGRVMVGDKNRFVRVTGGESPDQWLTASGELADAPEPFGRMLYSSLLYGDTLLLGTKPDGLFALTGSTLKPVEGTQGLSIYALERDRKGRIWIGSLQGLYRLDDLESEPQKIQTNERVRSLLIVSDSIMLVGGDNVRTSSPHGFYTFNINQSNPKIHYTVPSPRTNVVMDILETREGEIFLATYGGGISRLDRNHLLTDDIPLQNFTTANGLASDICLSMAEGNDGRLCIVSEDALTTYNPADSSFVESRNGVFTSNFSFTECPPYVNGNQLLLGTSQGLLTLNTSHLPVNDFVPPIVFSCPDTVNLSPDERSFMVTFAALDYNKIENIRYAYRLEGLDDEWHITSERTITYANLPPKTYTLHVRSTNGSGQWTDNERTVTIHRSARITETRWFWIAVGIISLLIIIVVLRVTKYIRDLQRELRAISTEKDERVEYLNARLRDLLSGTAVEPTPAPEAVEPEVESKLRQQVLDYLEEHYCDSELAIDDIGVALGMGHNKLYREIKTVFGISPNNLLQEFRIGKAVELLQHGESNVSEIAYACGWSDPKYFSKVFKKHKGCSPSEFGKN